MKTTIPSFGATAPAKKPEAEPVKGGEGETVPEDITAFYRYFFLRRYITKYIIFYLKQFRVQNFSFPASSLT